MGEHLKRRGHVEERPNGKFRAIAYAGFDQLTRRKRYLKKTADTPEQAEIELTKLLNQIDERRHPRSNVTVGEVIDSWLEVADLATVTRRRYVQLIDAYIKPTFGTRPAAELDVELLERFYARLQRCNKLCNGTRRRDHTCDPLSCSTVRQIHWKSRISTESAIYRGKPGRTYCLCARSRDTLANLGTWSTPRCTATPVDDRTLTRHDTWTRQTGKGHYLHTYTRSRRHGATLTLSGVRAKHLALLVTRVPGGGKVAVSLAGTTLGTYRLASPSVAKKQLIPVKKFPSIRKGTLRIRIVSPTGKPVQIDGVLASRT